MLFPLQQYTAGRRHVFESTSPLVMKLMAIPVAMPGVILLFLLLSQFWETSEIDGATFTDVFQFNSNPGIIEMEQFWSIVIILLIMIPSLGFAAIAVLGINRLTVDDETNTATYEFVLLKSFRRQTWKLKENKGVAVGYNRREGGWIVGLSNAKKPLAITAREKSARMFALTAAKRLGATLNGVENEKISFSLGQHLVDKKHPNKIPTKRKGGIVSVESREDCIVLRNPPTLSLKTPLAGITLILSVLWYYLWPIPTFPEDKIFIVLLLLIGLSVFIIGLVVSSYAHELFEIVVTLSPGSISIQQNFKLFARSKKYAFNEIRELYKGTTGIVLVAEFSTTCFAEGVATIDRSFICNYIKYWLVHEQ